MPFTTSPIWATQVLSSGLGILRRHNWMNMTKKLTNSTTPMIGCSHRAVCPPPKRPVRKYSDGWKNARPDNSSRISEIAVIQWFARMKPR